MIKDHFDAVTALLEDAASLADKVFDTARLDDSGQLVRANYVVLQGGIPRQVGDGRLTSLQTPDSAATWPYTARCVGVDADSVRLVQQSVFNALLGSVPTISGRKCDPVNFPDQQQKLLADNSVKPPLMYGDLEFWFISKPA